MFPISLCGWAGAPPVESVINLQSLPLTVLSFVSERAIIGGGHDFNPAIFTGQPPWHIH